MSNKEKELIKETVSPEGADNEIRQTAEGADESVISETAEGAENTVSQAAIPDANNEIRETTGDAVEIYDEDDSVDLADSLKKKKKRKKLFIILPIVALVAAGAIFAFINSKKTVAPIVTTQEVAKGTIENIISISGTVESADTKNYFAEVAAQIETLDVKVGDKVSKGDTLCTFDVEELELAERKAELALQQAEGSYSSQITKNAKATDKLVGNSIHDINNRIDEIDEEKRQLDDKITEKKNRIKQTQDELNRLLLDYNQNKISDDFETDAKSSRKDKDGNELYLQTQLALKDVAWALEHDSELVAWQDRIDDLDVERKKLTEQQSAELSAMTAGDFKSAAAQKETSELTNGDTIAKLEAAREGIKADFNGVITAIPATVMEGATVASGTQLLTVANLDDVQVSIQVSKSDLPKISVGEDVDITINGKPYQGKIEKISGNAVKNNNGVAMVDTKIRILNPDLDIILGVEANNKIHAQKAENTIVLPYENVQTDSQGDYVYVVEDGMVTRKDVTIGISNSTEAEITDGLSVGDLVITSDVTDLIEGTMVTIQ